MQLATKGVTPRMWAHFCAHAHPAWVREENMDNPELGLSVLAGHDAMSASEVHLHLRYLPEAQEVWASVSFLGTSVPKFNFYEALTEVEGHEYLDAWGFVEPIHAWLRERHEKFLTALAVKNAAMLQGQTALTVALAKLKA